MYACSSLALGWAVDRYNWPRTYVMAAAYLLLAGMYVLEVSGLASWVQTRGRSTDVANLGRLRITPSPLHQS